MATVNVRVERSGDRVTVIAPYHPQFPASARQAGGRWDAAGKRWSFDARDEERVREICRSIYGTDGSVEAATVTIRYRVTDSADNPLWYAGRLIVERRGRDEAVRLGDGVVIIEGRFASSGGSMKYPRLEPSDVVLEIRDVPAGLVTESDDVTILASADARRATLEARLAEIEAEAARIRRELARL
jgi:hypothetical protein